MPSQYVAIGAEDGCPDRTKGCSFPSACSSLTALLLLGATAGILAPGSLQSWSVGPTTKSLSSIGQFTHRELLAETPQETDAGCAAANVSSDGVLAWLRSQAFNLRTEDALSNHPMVRAAEAGTMNLDAVRLVLLEEYSIETTDLRSMAVALARHGGADAARSFFLAATDSENVARQKLITMASVLGMSEDDLRVYQPMPTAHAYTSFLAELSNYGGMAAVAASFAVNFPAWGRMCGRVADALTKRQLMSEKDVDFLRYFAAPVPGYDAAATAVIAAGMKRGESLCDIRRGVMLLQGYERMFWDSVWAKSLAGRGAHLVEPLHV